jgi:hypothetical protein
MGVEVGVEVIVEVGRGVLVGVGLEGLVGLLLPGQPVRTRTEVSEMTDNKMNVSLRMGSPAWN